MWAFEDRDLFCLAHHILPNIEQPLSKRKILHHFSEKENNCIMLEVIIFFRRCTGNKDVLLQHRLSLIPDRGHRLQSTYEKNQATALFTMGMRTVWAPYCPAACRPPVPWWQEPDPGACGHWALREDGRKQMANRLPPGPNLHEVTQKRMATEATVRFYKGDVMSHATVTSRFLGYPAGQL